MFLQILPGRSLPMRMPEPQSGTHEDRLRELYLVALSRPPTPAEMTGLLTYLQARRANPQAAYEDILWALLNTKELQFNH